MEQLGCDTGARVTIIKHGVFCEVWADGEGEVWGDGGDQGLPG